MVLLPFNSKTWFLLWLCKPELEGSRKHVENFKLHENNDVEFKSVAFAASYPFVCASGVSWRERIPFNVNMNGSPWQTDTMT